MASLNEIDHFVVLMLENRSFDNLLGAPGNFPRADPAVNGLRGDESNPDPKSPGGIVTVWNGADDDRKRREEAWLPKPDPGELFSDMNEQLGLNLATGPMSGFAANYAAQGGDAADIMHYFSSQQLPHLTSLAASYAVCDAWFASAPCQTWPNRFFIHTGTAGGYENNLPTHFPYQMPTIFDALDPVAPNGWEVYFHDFPQALTLSQMWGRLDRFKFFGDFLDDAKHGQLPSYAFIEPRYFPDVDWPNDMHPPHNVTYGDQLVEQVYRALRQSPAWNKTMLIILCDEHGGCYDHVEPPPAAPPEDLHPGQVFAFDRYGVRVPAVIVSPWIAPGTVLRAGPGQPYDHTSVISTLRRRFGIPEPLTRRDAQAPTLEAVLTLDAPSDAGRAVLQALPPPPEDTALALTLAKTAPLNDFQRALQQTAAHLAPLMHGVTVDNHVAALLAGFKPLVPLADTPHELLPYLQSVLRKLLP